MIEGELARLVVELARLLGEAPRTRDVGSHRRIGTVTATALDGTVSVNIGGTVVPGVPRLTSYTATVSDTVMVDICGGSPIVVGKSAAA